MVFLLGIMPKGLSNKAELKGGFVERDHRLPLRAQSQHGIKLWRPLDIVVILSILAGGIWSFTRVKDDSGKKSADVYIGSRHIARFPLDSGPDTTEIKTNLGVVLLQHGEEGIRVLSSPCMHKYCIRQGLAHRSYHKIICAPARLMVTVRQVLPSTTQTEQPDAISR